MMEKYRPSECPEQWSFWRTDGEMNMSGPNHWTVPLGAASLGSLGPMPGQRHIFGDENRRKMVM